MDEWLEIEAKAPKAFDLQAYAKRVAAKLDQENATEEEFLAAVKAAYISISAAKAKADPLAEPTF
jgi:hypothetical protein